MLRELVLLGLHTLQERQRRFLARDGNEVADALHDGTGDVGCFVSGWVDGGDAGGDEGELGPASFEIAEEGVRVAGAGDVDKSHGRFENHGRDNFRMGLFEIEEAGSVKGVVETVGVFGAGLAGERGGGVESFFVEMELAQAVDVVID